MRSASDPLLARLVDDAALFPPGNAPMVRALAEHAAHRSTWYAAAVGPFLCPASRVDELVAALPADQHVDLAIVVDVSGDGAHNAWRGAAADHRITLVAVEVAHAYLADSTTAVGENVARAAGVTGFLEVPRTGFEAALDLIRDGGWDAAKYRTGGVTADAFPDERELAAFLVACAERDLPFKLTAGLHHALRATSTEGFEQHGVLNVLAATRVATSGAGPQAVAMVLAQRQPGPVVELVQSWDDSTCTDVRRAWRSFGCCGVTDPLDDLRAHGLLDSR